MEPMVKAPKKKKKEPQDVMVKEEIPKIEMVEDELFEKKNV